MSRLLLALVLLIGLSGCAMLGGKGPSPETGAAEPVVKRLWSARLGETPANNSYRLVPAVDDSRVYAANAQGRLAAHDRSGGDLLWERNLDSQASAGPATDGSLVVVGTRSGQVIALNPVDGETLWDAEVSSEVIAPPAVDYGVVVVRSGDGRLFGLDARSGRRLWMYDRNQPALTLRGTGSPLLQAGVVLAGLDNGKLVALEPRDGAVGWELEVGIPSGRSDLERMVDVDGDPVIHGSMVYAASYQGRIAAVGIYTGRPDWTKEFSTHVGLGVDNERVYGVDVNNQLWGLARYSGATIWRYDELKDFRLTTPVAWGNYVIVGDSEGYLNWLTAREGRLVQRVRVDSSEIREAPVIVDDTLYVQSVGGRLGAYRLALP